MNSSPCTIGLDLGSCYVKAVALDAQGNVVAKRSRPTGYNYTEVAREILRELGVKSEALGVTGYGRHELAEATPKTEITCMAKGLLHEGVTDGTLVDIGGQDCKVLQMSEGKLKHHNINRRCAAGTGAYLEFLAFRLNLKPEEMNQLGEQAEASYPLNSFCTVFASTEILDCIRRKVPVADLIRGMYSSVAQRAREIAPLIEPVYLSGGVVAHHPVAGKIFSEVFELPVKIVSEPQYLAATGSALFAREAS